MAGRGGGKLGNTVEEVKRGKIEDVKPDELMEEEEEEEEEKEEGMED